VEAPAERLRRRIRESGPVPFASFMEEALYGVGGYYARRDLPIGEGGDFVTGSSLSPLFGRATARLLESLDRALGRRADYLEVGYGTATHLTALTAALGEAGMEGRRVLAYDRVARSVPAGVTQLDSLEAAGRHALRGLVFSYELFDALPIHRLIGRGNGEVGELWVALEGERFAWQEGGLSDPSLATLLPAELAVGQVADLAPGWRPLYRRLVDLVGAGLVATFDYGFESGRLLDPRVRRHGTLACYRSHRVHRDPFRDPGREDLSAHVDLGALIAEGEAAGVATLALTRQAPWLVACGLLGDVSEGDAGSRIAAQQLLALDGMGEEIRVLIQGREFDRRDLPELARLADSEPRALS